MTSRVVRFVFRLWAVALCACGAPLLLVPLVAGAAAPMIASGRASTALLNQDGSVWGTGEGTNTTAATASPVRLFPPGDVASVASYAGVTLAVRTDGTLWGAGRTISAGNLVEPQRVEGLSGVKAVAVARHILVLKDDGTLWAWGNNQDGQLGDGTRTDRYVPAQVPGLGGVTRVAASFNASLALKSDGTVWFWGDGSGGSAGDGTLVGSYDPDRQEEMYRTSPVQVHNLDRVVAIAAGWSHHMALREDGTVWTWGMGFSGQNGIGVLAPQPLPVQIPGLDQVVAIAVGTQFSLALKSDGTVWAWGVNNRGQLGVAGITLSATPIQVPQLSSIRAISAGEDYVLAMNNDGIVFGWGANDKGQLADGTLTSRADARAVLGPGGTNQLNLIAVSPVNFNMLPTATITLSVESGNAPLTVGVSATKASDPDGQVNALSFYWSTNDGQVATDSSATFVFNRAGTFDITLIVEDDAQGRSIYSRTVVVAPAAATVNAVPKVGMTQTSSIGLETTGRILTWGSAFTAALPQTQPTSGPWGSSVPIAIGISGVTDFSTGMNQMFVLLADGSVLGWGLSQSGEVGIGGQLLASGVPQQLPGLPAVQSLAAGHEHSLALTRDGRVFAWGSNREGELGLGDNVNRSQAVEIAGLGNVTAVAAGHGFSVALKDDGTVWAWGVNYSDQLGDGTRVSRNRPGQVAGLNGIRRLYAIAGAMIAQAANGSVWVTGQFPISLSGDTGQSGSLRRVPALDGMVQIAGSVGHMVMLKLDGTVWTAGLQSSGALGFAEGGDVPDLRQVPGVSDGVQVAAGEIGSMVLRRDGTVLSWGFNPHGQLGDGTLAKQPTPVVVVNETFSGPLDLIPDVANAIPLDKIPPFLVATSRTGSSHGITVSAEIRGLLRSGSFSSASDPGGAPFGRFAASGFNVYVLAHVPGLASPYFQLDSGNNWGAFQWPMSEFMRGVTLQAQTDTVTASILRNADVSPLIGASVIVGYGADADEMASAGRYRTIFTVGQD